MATLPPSLALSCCCVNCGATKSSKLKLANRILCRNKVFNRLDKMNLERKLLFGQIVPHFSNTFLRNTNMEVNATSRVSIPVKERFSRKTEAEEPDKVSSYLFRTEVGGLVKVLVKKKSVNCGVHIEVSSLPLSNSDDSLILKWGIYRGDSSNFMPIEFSTSAPDDRTVETPFLKTSFGKFVVEMEFESENIPCYLSFLLRSQVNIDSSGLEIRSHRKTNFCVPLGFGSGYATPLGLSFSQDGSMNFAIFSRNAESVVLCFYDDPKGVNPALELDLDSYVNRSGDVWHASFNSAWTFVSYGYQLKGTRLKGSNDVLEASRVVLDPYARIIGNYTSSDQVTGPKYLGRLSKEPGFDWTDDIRPNLPMEKLMVYRLNVRRFTEHKSSHLLPDIAGTFSGLAEKLGHFKALGVNAVLLEPIFPFDEQKGPYFPCHFFSPMNLYGPSGGATSAINSMKEMVKQLHANGIEVLLEVVFTHTAENGALQGIDDSSYYLNGVEDLDARNALNCNYPIVQQIILDSLRHWVTAFHIDGFCFINASSLLRGCHGEYLSRPPLVEAIAFDPLLSKTKIIADCWVPHDIVPRETRFPHWKRWAEMNMRFCYDIRKFLRGEELLSSLATRLCGSGDIFSEGRGPAFSFNFVTRNSGLPLVDLVSFSGEELASELSWNCGEEGPTNKTLVLERRLKQIRNFLFILYVSLGVPVLNMGDECGQTTGGSPAYNDRKSFDWNALKTGFGIQITQFISFLSSLRRRRSDLLQKRKFLKEENIDWHGSDQSPPNWEEPTSKFLAMSLRADEDSVENQMTSESSSSKGDLFIAFNAADHPESVILPPPAEGTVWHRLVDTALPFPGFFSTDGEPVVKQESGLFAYEMKPLSCTMFEAIVK
ncbi:Glycoside hydrolase [Parasponia andersonii]|uniref:Glycoside hydrolase n=1 Tax=Parasponia andersonii TaxID=3476 RepID=A0A2P5CXK0_PARAD|nr:Glycoside hydrolase [Parasponia andersonii]